MRRRLCLTRHSGGVEGKLAPGAPGFGTNKAVRKWKSESLFGTGVLELCRMADIVFLALHGSCGEDGRVQAALDVLGIPFTGADYLNQCHRHG